MSSQEDMTTNGKGKQRKNSFIPHFQRRRSSKKDSITGQLMDESERPQLPNDTTASSSNPFSQSAMSSQTTLTNNPHLTSASRTTLTTPLLPTTTATTPAADPNPPNSRSKRSRFSSFSGSTSQPIYTIDAPTTSVRLSEEVHTYSPRSAGHGNAWSEVGDVARATSSVDRNDFMEIMKETQGMNGEELRAYLKARNNGIQGADGGKIMYRGNPKGKGSGYYFMTDEFAGSM